MIKKVNQETYKKLVSELLYERMENLVRKEAYERQYSHTLSLLTICLLELGAIIWFICALY